MRRIITLALTGCMLACGCAGSAGAEKPGSGKKKKKMDEYEILRLEMVKKQIEARGIKDERVLAAMRKVPRHDFVPEQYKHKAYEDHPLPIGHKQTISQPYIVAIMSQSMKLDGAQKVLEVGTGSGYQAAVLSHLAKEVHSIEIVPELVKSSKKILAELGYDNVTIHEGDGYAGLVDEEPFDAIMITAAPPKIPQPLKEQLAIGGRLVVPVGEHFQSLMLLTRTSETTWEQEQILPAVVFVPMTGKIQQD
jgi:protein-L-isoaspartate(D-aspartate) O-methyltransferase